MNSFFQIQILLSGIIAGWIIFQTAFVAPTVFTKLEDAEKALVLRAIFPKLFKALAVAGLLHLALGLLAQLTISGAALKILPLLVGAYTLISSFLCNAIVPATNAARDRNDNKKFAQLHRVSVSLTMLTLLLHLGWMFVTNLSV